MIIAIKEKDRIVVATSIKDEYSTGTHTMYTETENIPIKVCNGNIFALASADRCADYILNSELLENIDVTPQAIVNEVIPALISETKKVNDMDEDEVWNDPLWNNGMIFANGNKMYSVNRFFTFGEQNNYIIYSTITDQLVGVMDITEGMKAEDRIRKACDMVKELSNLNYYPLAVADTASKKIRIMEEK